MVGIGALACDGAVDDGGVDGAPPACSSEAPCTGGLICVEGECTESVCGDMIVDGPRGEACDDGNDIAFDGCEPDTCAFTCVEDATCIDPFECNGVERCEAHRCVPGTALGDGAACALDDAGGDGVCRGMDCVPPGCGNGVVDSGEECDDMNETSGDGCENDCTFTCETDADCNDGSVCTGEETCELATHTCVAGTEMSCEDGDPCTMDSCDTVAGCTFSLIDADGDGHAASTLGSCGDDCDDADETVFGGAEELCDGIDNDCDGVEDEVAPFWFVDCDGDGYAASTDSSRQSCDEPPATGCGGGWTNTRPLDLDTTDCHDGNAMVHPGPHSTCHFGGCDERFYTTPYTRATGGSSWDYDCDGVTERQYGCVSSSAACNDGCGFTNGGGSDGFLCSVAPWCGMSETLSECASLVVCTDPPCTGDGCARSSTTETQGCR